MVSNLTITSIQVHTDDFHHQKNIDKNLGKLYKIPENILSAKQKSILWAKIKNLHRIDNRQTLDDEYKYITENLKLSVGLLNYFQSKLFIL